MDRKTEKLTLAAMGKGRIGRRLVIATILFSSLITLMASAFQLYLDYENGLETIQENFERIENSHLESLITSVWMYDDRQIATQLDGLLKLPDLEFLEITAGDAHKWAAGKQTSAHTITREFLLIFRHRDQSFTIGSLTAVSGLDNVYDRLIGKAVSILIINAVRAFCVSGFILFIFHVMVTRHLARLSESLDNLDLNRLPVKIDLGKKPNREPDEIDRVVQAINQTREKLYDSYKALIESEDELSRIFTMSMDMICIADINTASFVKVNPAFTKTLGYSEEELLSTTFMEFIHPDDVAPTQRVVEERLRAGEGVINFQNRYRCRDGSYRWLRWVSNPVEEKGITYALAHDITDIREAMAEQEILAEQLRQSHKMEAVGTLAGGIAHDFNNILGIIVGNTELAMDDVPARNPARSNLEEIKTAGMRARDMVQQLLSFARKTGLRKKPLDPAPIIRESVEMLRAFTPDSVDIRVEIGEVPGPVMADPAQIRQVIINLCTNAVHAMEETGGRLSVTLSQQALDIEDLPPGNYLALTVSDTGPGIDPGIRDRIFDPYFTTKDVGKGSGMGLAIVHGIVKNHDGMIRIDETTEKGTTVRIFFPVCGQAAGAVSPGSTPP